MTFQAHPPPYNPIAILSCDSGQLVPGERDRFPGHCGLHLQQEGFYPMASELCSGHTAWDPPHHSDARMLYPPWLIPLVELATHF